MGKKKIKNKYIIRKVVNAESVAEALQKEKRSPVAEVTLIASEGTQFIPAIGFMPNRDIEDDNE